MIDCRKSNLLWLASLVPNWVPIGWKGSIPNLLFPHLQSKDEAHLVAKAQNSLRFKTSFSLGCGGGNCEENSGMGAKDFNVKIFLPITGFWYEQ